MPPAEQVLAFLRSLPIVSGLKAGATLELLPFQEDFVRGVYAPADDAGKRLVRLAALSVARGNGKSALLAGLSLAHLLGPMAEPYGEAYAAALDREQAGVLFRMVRAYIEATPWMAARVNIRDWHKEITDEDSRSIWRALTLDARKAHGLAPSYWIADEVAQWRSRELWDNLRTGMAKRDQALGVTISTQAKDDIHFWSEMLDAPEVPTFYRQLHAAPAECALDDRDAWAAANPALGAFLNEAEFADAAEMAQRSPSFEPAFRNLNLNQRVDASDRFIGAADWEANGDAFDAIELEGQRCYGGLDLSSTTDLTALALWFPEAGKLLCWHFVPADTISACGRGIAGSRPRPAARPIGYPSCTAWPTFAAAMTCRESRSTGGGSRIWRKCSPMRESPCPWWSLSPASNPTRRRWTLLSGRFWKARCSTTAARSCVGRRGM